MKKYISHLNEGSEFSSTLEDYQKEIDILSSLNFDPVIQILEKTYSPKPRGKKRREPVCMLRSLFLMTLIREKSISKWVRKTRTFGCFFGILAGFNINDTPGVGTYYNFFDRIIDAPFSPYTKGQIRRSQHNAMEFERNIGRESDAKKEDRNPNHTKSEKLANELMADALKPREPGFNTILEDMLFLLVIKPAIEAGLITEIDNLVVTGDGSIMKTAASKNGKATCECRKNGEYKCGHSRIYSSRTAQICYDHHHDRFVFGDRYYHLIITQNGHDFPIHAHMPGGNESDYTLSLTSIDRNLKMLNEHNSDANISTFCGDGHHDSYAHYDYFDNKNIIPVIPLAEKSKSVVSQLPDNKDVRLNEAGIPLCRAGMPMRHHQYNKKRKTHVFCCPVKRQTHRKGKTVYVTHIDECPLKKDCQPESPLGPLVYIKSKSNPRLFPPVPRGSRQYEKIMNQRSGSERVNAYIDNHNIERAHRNADYSLIRIFLVYIAIHAEIMYKELIKIDISEKLPENAMDGHSSSIEFDKIMKNIRDGPLNKPP